MGGDGHPAGGGGLRQDAIDPYTNEPQPLGFRGWQQFAQDARRLSKQAPQLLQVQAAWRREKLAHGPWPEDPADRRVAVAQVRVGLEILEGVMAGVL